MGAGIQVRGHGFLPPPGYTAIITTGIATIATGSATNPEHHGTEYPSSGLPRTPHQAAAAPHHAAQQAPPVQQHPDLVQLKITFVYVC